MQLMQCSIWRIKATAARLTALYMRHAPPQQTQSQTLQIFTKQLNELCCHHLKHITI
jgi:hypothetical protein